MSGKTIVFLNGQFVPDDQAVVSVFDRSFLYGDGLFETMRVLNGKLFRWEQHFQRLAGGAKYLGLRLPYDSVALLQFADRLITENRVNDALLRLTVSRGVGVRGYSPKGADQPTSVMSVHSAPAISPSDPVQWRLVTSSFRIPANESLAQFKTCNKLAQILARAEADAAAADEALLLNTDGFVVEGASSNLFWVQDRTVCTPPLASGILAGVTRAVVMEICRKLDIPSRESSITPHGLKNCQAIFVSLSSFGIAEVIALDGSAVARSELLPSLQRAYAEIVLHETAQGKAQPVLA